MPHLVWGILQPEDGAQACDGCNNSLHLANLWRLTRLLAGKQENVENVFSQSIREWTFPSSVIPNIVWEGTRGPTHIFALVHPAKHPQTISHTRMHARSLASKPPASTRVTFGGEPGARLNSSCSACMARLMPFLRSNLGRK
eukprot:scaffold75833_cov18-Tisochrysis_lutea.AAC.1